MGSVQELKIGDSVGELSGLKLGKSRYEGLTRSLASEGRRSVYVARPDGSATDLPCVVVCHERYGFVQHTVDIADRFAANGFVAIAPDFYSDVDDIEDRDDLPRLSDAHVREHLQYAKQVAIEAAGSIVGKYGILGVCRSGRYGLVENAFDDEVTAVGVLYGAAQPWEFEHSEDHLGPLDELIKKGKAPVYGVWGERDHVIPVANVRRLRDIVEDAGRTYDFWIVKDAPHGWLNDTMPGRYREESAESVWAGLLEFFQKTLRHQEPANYVTSRYFAEVGLDYDFNKNVRFD